MPSQTEFLHLITQNQGIIRKLVGLYARNEEDKSDLYQEVLLQAWKGFASFKGQSKFSTWLYRVSLNTLLTTQRRHTRTEYREHLEEHLATEPHQSVASENKQLLYAAIRALPATDRAIISAHLDGYSNPEIADIMGISANHIAVKLHRIKQALTNLLQPQ